MNELNYLIELAKLNIENAKLSLQILFGLTTIVAFAFIGVLIFIIRELKKISEERKLTAEDKKQIEKLKQDFMLLTEQIDKTKNDVQNLALKSQKLSDDDIGKFIEKELKLSVNLSNMNIMRNFIIRIFNVNEWSNSLNILKDIWKDQTLTSKIEEEYRIAFGELISKFKQLEWCYLIKKKGENIDNLIDKEAKEDTTRPQFTRAWQEFFLTSSSREAQKRSKRQALYNEYLKRKK